MRVSSLRILAWGLAVAAGGWAMAGPAHQHGVARLDIGVEPARVSLRLESAPRPTTYVVRPPRGLSSPAEPDLLKMPLDNLLGFERAPRTEAERAAVDAALARLRDATLFRIDSAAGCQPVAPLLKSEPLGLGGAAPSKDGHADLEGVFDFRCSAGARAGFVEVGLFEAFPRLQRIEMQIVTARGQMKATLRRPNSRVALPR